MEPALRRFRQGGKGFWDRSAVAAHLQDEVCAAAAVLAHHGRRARGALAEGLPGQARLRKAAQLAADHVRGLPQWQLLPGSSCRRRWRPACRGAGHAAGRGSCHSRRVRQHSGHQFHSQAAGDGAEPGARHLQGEQTALLGSGNRAVANAGRVRPRQGASCRARRASMGHGRR